MEREALKLALEALEEHDYGVAQIIIREALAQPAQEPVAWMEKDVLPLTHIIKAVVRRENDETYTEPLYTAPPQRTWVGLTDEQQEEMYQMTDNIADCRTCYFQGIADAEAAHNRGAKT